ncbi:morphogenic membrane protein MmpB [Streptomyces sp. NPDC088923]
MLWSDRDQQEPPEEWRAAQKKLHRAGVLLACVMVLAMLLLGLGGYV